MLSCDCPHLNIHKDRLTDWKYFRFHNLNSVH